MKWDSCTICWRQKSETLTVHSTKFVSISDFSTELVISFIIDGIYVAVSHFQLIYFIPSWCIMWWFSRIFRSRSPNIQIWSFCNKTGKLATTFDRFNATIKFWNSSILTPVQFYQRKLKANLLWWINRMFYSKIFISPITSSATIPMITLLFYHSIRDYIQHA